MIFNLLKCANFWIIFFKCVTFIVIKPGPGVDPANPGQPGLTRKNKIKIKILIFHMKKSM
jgi:hypothetical protein